MTELRSLSFSQPRQTPCRRSCPVQLRALHLTAVHKVEVALQWQCALGCVVYNSLAQAEPEAQTEICRFLLLPLRLLH